MLADDVELLNMPILFPADVEAVDPGAVPHCVSTGIVGEENHPAQEDIEDVGLLVAAFDVNLVFNDVTDDLLLLLPELLLGALVSTLLRLVEQPLLLGQLSGLEAVLGHSRQVVDSLSVAAPPAVVLRMI